MRVLHFFKEYAPDSFGGTQSVIRDIAHATAPLGIETTVLSLSRDPERNSVWIEGHRAEKARLDFEVASAGFSFSAFSAFARLSAGVDVVHYHFPWPTMDIVHFSTRQRRPCLVTYHSDIVRQRLLRAVYAPLMRAFLGSVDAIVATSPNYLASSPVLPRFGDRVGVIPLGVRDSAAVTVPDAAITGWRDRLGERFFLFVGALRYYKGLARLLEAAEATGYPVAIVGAGEQAPELADTVRHRRLANVHLLGAVGDADKLALLRAAFGFVFPSDLRSEAFGVALLEAAAESLPLISCEIGTGTSFANIDGETGFVLPPGDPVALAAAMRRLWDDPALTARLGHGARARYAAHFTAEAMGRAYAALYRRLASLRPAPA
ncbi:MAG: glycosyltransferase [Devosia sp.]|nr:glycosyltransferase [Devosia sp.]